MAFNEKLQGMSESKKRKEKKENPKSEEKKKHQNETQMLELLKQ